MSKIAKNLEKNFTKNCHLANWQFFAIQMGGG